MSRYSSGPFHKNLANPYCSSRYTRQSYGVDEVPAGRRLNVSYPNGKRVFLFLSRQTPEPDLQCPGRRSRFPLGITVARETAEVCALGSSQGIICLGVLANLCSVNSLPQISMPHKTAVSPKDRPTPPIPETLRHPRKDPSCEEQTPPELIGPTAQVYYLRTDLRHQGPKDRLANRKHGF